MHTAQLLDGHVRFGETHAFVGPRFLITVRHGASLSYRHVRARFEREPEFLSQGPAFALYGILDFVVDNYQPIVNEFRDELNVLENDIFAAEFRRETIVKLYDLKKELTQLRLAVAPLQDILAQLTRTQMTQVTDEAKLYFRDVLDRGFTDAHMAHGRGWTTSWPTDEAFPPFVRLDHALTNLRLVSTAVDDFRIPGSDHAVLIVTVKMAETAET